MINIAIIGYGNLGRGVENAVKENADINLVGIFTRRPPNEVKTTFQESKVYKIETLVNFKDKIDVCILCGGSKNDIRKQAPDILKNFNCVDSFDTHADIPEYLAEMDALGKKSNHLAIVSGGWDPGIFSLMRLLFSAFLPGSVQNTFWGPGVTQGHSEAVRRLPGVKYGIQYTVPKEEGVKRAKAGETPATREKHMRVCYVVAENGANKKEIEKAIKTMPSYFAEYDTEVNFISEEEFLKNHSKMPHGGMVIQSGKTGSKNNVTLKYEHSLEDNPGFTSSILVSLARACFKMAARGETGAVTMFDVKPVDYAFQSRDTLIKQLM